MSALESTTDITLVGVPDQGPDDGSDLFAICAEEVHVPERLIAAPAAGVFRAAPARRRHGRGRDRPRRAGRWVTIEITGGSVTVTSAHTGFLMGLLALPGERVRAEQPLAWVRVVS